MHQRYRRNRRKRPQRSKGQPREAGHGRWGSQRTEPRHATLGGGAMRIECTATEFREGRQCVLADELGQR